MNEPTPRGQAFRMTKDLYVREATMRAEAHRKLAGTTPDAQHCADLLALAGICDRVAELLAKED